VAAALLIVVAVVVAQVVVNAVVTNSTVEVQQETAFELTSLALNVYIAYM
jgi:hypothetical protein